MSRRGWWRRNALALGVLVVLLPASAFAIGLHDWTSAHTGTALSRTDPVPVAEGATGDLFDATWGPIRAGRVHDTTGLTPAPGTKIIAVSIPVHVDPSKPVLCDSPLLVEQGTGRQWNEMAYELGIQEQSTDNLQCVPDAAEDYDLVAAFMVPEDSTGPYWVEVVPYRMDAEGAPVGSEGRFVRFAVDAD